MSTIAMSPANASALAAPKRRSSLVQRLIKWREEAARQRIRAYLAAMDDARLAGLGFTADDIQALRRGEFRLASGKITV
jgi:uncharacterized protein YjiS (DUF1127 family)